MEEVEDVTVKIKLVVNYNGSLENFIVIKSGREIVDNEVQSVLKKNAFMNSGKKQRASSVSLFYNSMNFKKMLQI